MIKSHRYNYLWWIQTNSQCQELKLSDPQADMVTQKPSLFDYFTLIFSSFLEIQKSDLLSRAVFFYFYAIKGAILLFRVRKHWVSSICIVKSGRLYLVKSLLKFLTVYIYPVYPDINIISLVVNVHSLESGSTKLLGKTKDGTPH